MIVFIFLSLLLTCIQCRSEADPSTGLVQTDCGLVQGLFVHRSLWIWKGIPYGSSHLGKNRWKPSKLRKESQECWNDVLYATKFGPMCTQKKAPKFVQHEDCLMINIWSPFNLTTINSTSHLPVLLYVHGGSLLTGDGGNLLETYPGYNPERLAYDGNAVVATINYRLNVFGALVLKELSKADPRNVSGNYAITDVITALRWIQKNINEFGGDKNRVTIFGQSSGGTVILALLASPSAKGLFHRAISMSGSPKIDGQLRDVEKLNRKDYLKRSPCANLSEVALLDCLYSADPFSLTEVYNDDTWEALSFLLGIPQPNDTMMQPLVFVDGVTVVYDINKALSSGLIDVPLIIGNVREEPDLQPIYNLSNFSPSQWEVFIKKKFSAFGPNVANGILQLYPLKSFSDAQQCYSQIVADKGTICGNMKLSQIAAKHFKSPVYNYVLVQGPTTKPICSFSENYCVRYAFHLWDLLTLFKDLNYLYDYSNDDISLTKTFLNRFIEFAYNGSLRVEPAFKTVNYLLNDNFTTILISKNSTAAVNYKLAQCSFWTKNGFDKFWWQN